MRFLSLNLERSSHKHKYRDVALRTALYLTLLLQAVGVPAESDRLAATAGAVLQPLEQLDEREVLLQPPHARVAHRRRLPVERAEERGAVQRQARQALVADGVTAEEQAWHALALQAEHVIAHPAFHLSNTSQDNIIAQVKEQYYWLQTSAL